MDRPLEDLAGKTVLEIGPGGGRFTEILVKHAESVICLEPGSAAHLNIAAPRANLIVIQEDLENSPIEPHIVDVALCRGVIQHTPRPIDFIDQLVNSVRPGGWIFFDFYARGNRLLHPRYWLRHMTRRLSPETMLRMSEKLVPPLTRFKWRLDDLGLPRKFTSRLVPVIDTRGEFGYPTESQIIRANILETFDCYTPRYDHPPLARVVLKYLRDGGHEFLSPPNLTANFFRVKRRSST